MTLDLKKLLIDSKRPGDVISLQITLNGNDANGNIINMATIRYTVGGKNRILSCEPEAISFEGDN